VLKISVFFFVFSASLRLCVKNAFRFAHSAALSLTSAKAILHFCSGGISRAIRCTCAISAEITEPPAAQNCQFGGFSAASRPSFQREICKICNKIALLLNIKFNKKGAYKTVMRLLKIFCISQYSQLARVRTLKT
jgi:hypothetical protein